MADNNTISYKVEIETQRAKEQLKSVRTEAQKVSNATGSAAANAKSSADSAGGVYNSCKNIKAALGKIATVLAVIKMAAAPVKMALEVAKLADEIDKTSQKLHLTYKEFQNWNFIAQRTGVDMASLGKIMRSYNTTMNGTGKTFEDAVREVQNLTDETKKNARAAELFGSQYSKIQPILNMTEADLDDLIKTQELLGGVMSDSAVVAGARVRDAVTNLQTAWQGLKNQLADALLPVLKTVVDWLTAIVAAISSIISKIRALFGGGGDGVAGSAVTATASVAGNMAGAAGSAAALKKTLMGFDRLNVLNGNSGGGGGGGGGGATVSDSGAGALSGGDYDNLSGKIQKVKDAFQKVAEVLQEIDEKLHITDGFKKLMETIQKVWEEKLAPSLATLKESLQDLWENEAFQYIMNFTVSTGFALLGDVFEYIGKQIASTITLLADYVNIMVDILNKDWEKARKDIKQYWKDAADLAVVNNLELLGDVTSTVVDNVSKSVEEADGKVADATKGLTESADKAVRKYVDNVNSAQREVNGKKISLGAVVEAVVGGEKFQSIASGASRFAETIRSTLEGKSPKFRIFPEMDKDSEKGVQSKLDGWKMTIQGIMKVLAPNFNSEGQQAALDWIEGWKMKNPTVDPTKQIAKVSNYTAPSDLQAILYPHAAGGVIQRPIIAGSHLMGEAGREAILPLDNNTEWADIIARKLNGASGGSVVLQVDGRQLGYAAINGINAITRTSGRCQLAF